MSYIPTIGLEIHAELKTATKMFCDCANDPEEKEPNVHVCPICLAHPGTLPTINKEAVKHVLKVGLAVGGTLADFTEFDRKNYFYPDIPKGYQISQYEFPLVSGGELAGVALTRIHLEEDTARSQHDKGDYSMVDFNRAGVPLMELVTEPVIHDKEAAVAFARELQLLLRALGASDADMEKGHMRVEANISVAKDGEELGKKVEVKNLNSFKSAGRAIEFEVTRQTKLLERGEKILQETRGWDEAKQETFSQRAKEGAADYRYFPDPDLPKLKISEVSDFSEEALRVTMPEKLPWELQEELITTFNIKKEDADMYIRDKQLGDFFIEVTELLPGNEQAMLASNYIANNLVTLRDELDRHVTEDVDANTFAAIIEDAHDGKISSNSAVKLIEQLARGASVNEVLKAKEGMQQENDADALLNVIKDVLKSNTDVAQDYKNGKESALQFLVGQGMKATQGKANPATLSELLKRELG